LVGRLEDGGVAVKGEEIFGVSFRSSYL
jgi:hypothetical protein